MIKRIALVLAAVLTAAACSTQSVGTVVPAGAATPPNATQAPATQAAPTEAPTEAPTPVVTPAPTGPATYKIGDAVTVQQEGKDWARFTISDVKVAPSYKGTYSTDTPKTAGNVFIQADVTIEALTDGVDFNPYDWQAYCAGTLIPSFAFVLNGPEPALHSGTLPNGRKASGYMVWEVPATGEVRMSYTGGLLSSSVVFEVIIRAA